MKIRAHHLLCMKYFKGKGYSQEFVDNFRKTIEKLKKNPSIKVTNSSDIICGSCPRNDKGKCIKRKDSDIKVRKKDNDIMHILGLKPSQEVLAENIKKLVNMKLPALRKTCKDCEWRKYCV